MPHCFSVSEGGVPLDSCHTPRGRGVNAGSQGNVKGQIHCNKGGPVCFKLLVDSIAVLLVILIEARFCLHTPQRQQTY